MAPVESSKGVVRFVGSAPLSSEMQKSSFANERSRGPKARFPLPIKQPVAFYVTIEWLMVGVWENTSDSLEVPMCVGLTF